MKKILLILLFICASITVIAQSKADKKYKDLAFEAVLSEDIESLSKYLDKGLTIDIKNERNESLMMYALYNKKYDVVSFLLERGANPNAQDDKKNTPFLYASATNEVGIVPLFIAKGVNYNIVDLEGNSALSIAAKNGNIDVVKIILKDKKAPVDMVNNKGWSPLIETIVMGDGSENFVKIVDLFIKAKANLNLEDAKGSTALEYAITLNYMRIFNLLKENGATYGKKSGEHIMILE